jgi:hypothetical protein
MIIAAVSNVQTEAVQPAAWESAFTW